MAEFENRKDKSVSENAKALKHIFKSKMKSMKEEKQFKNDHSDPDKKATNPVKYFHLNTVLGIKRKLNKDRKLQNWQIYRGYFDIQRSPEDAQALDRTSFPVLPYLRYQNNNPNCTADVTTHIPKSTQCFRRCLAAVIVKTVYSHGSYMHERVIYDFNRNEESRTVCHVVE
ncbi:hypothetical protein P5673_000166 [Acropora cervicornis]|uniref:Uncharacterized protein n=1 Tax=Acropora cervicornis TaxID=6130 RepID=A0AAD9R704_ACRCE|nr:hypothetical protein P5673_000166 [Acropora cervicornis]